MSLRSSRPRGSTRVRAAPSRAEPGIARFDVAQDRADPTRFLLIEVYRSEQATAAHKATAHYAAWRDKVEPMMAEPRARRSYDALDPEAEDW
jgi:autoinducer 2-degrading protein